VLCRLFPEFRNNQYKRTEAITAGAAAGMSVAFGAPVGGVLFALEEVASFFPHKTMWRAFFCAMVASVTLQSINPYQSGKLDLFEVHYTKSWYWFELFPFALLGIMGGLMGALFIRTLSRVASFRTRSRLLQEHPLAEVALVALITTSVKFLSSFLRGNNNAVLAALFGDCFDETGSADAPIYDPLSLCDPSFVGQTLASLVLVSVCTFFLTCFSWGMMVPGGVFIPTMIIGACNGRVLGTLMRAWQRAYSPALFHGTDPFTPGIYALVGAAAMLGGVTRMTVCLTVIMFEISNSADYCLPIMIGLVAAKLTGDACNRRAIFEEHLALRGYPFLSSKDRVPPRLLVRDAMSRDLLALPMHGHSIRTLSEHLTLLKELRITGVPIITSMQERFIVGYINRSELMIALKRAEENPQNGRDTRCYFAMLSLRFPKHEPFVDLRPWLHPSPVQVVEHTPLYRAHDIFRKLGLRFVLVTNFGRLVGILTKKDVQSAVAKHTGEHEQQLWTR